MTNDKNNGNTSKRQSRSKRKAGSASSVTPSLSSTTETDSQQESLKPRLPVHGRALKTNSEVFEAHSVQDEIDGGIVARTELAAGLARVPTTPGAEAVSGPATTRGSQSTIVYGADEDDNEDSEAEHWQDEAGETSARVVTKAELVIPVQAQTVDIDEMVQQIRDEERTAQEMEETESRNKRKRTWRCRIYVGLAFGLLLLGMAVLIVLLVLPRGVEPTQAPGSASPMSPPSVAPTETYAPTQLDLEAFWTALIQSRSPSTTFEDPSSPQQKALKWMLSDEYTLSLKDDNRVVQRFALATLWYATSGNITWNGGGWLNNTSECEWSSEMELCSEDKEAACEALPVFFLFCDGQEIAESLLLSGANLVGSIPEEIGLLSSLKELDLSNNHISGTMPTQIGLLTSLLFLDLLKSDFGNLGGSIPTEIGLLSTLQYLNLGRQKLSGTLSPELGMLTGLQYFDVDGNALSGVIPTELGLWTSLTWLGLQYNGKLAGTIPSEIMIPSLTGLVLHSNDFVGELPPELSNLVNLEELWLYNTRITGTIPSSLCLSNGGKLNMSSIDCGEIECECCVAAPGAGSEIWFPVPCESSNYYEN